LYVLRIAKQTAFAERDFRFRYHIDGYGFPAVEIVPCVGYVEAVTVPPGTGTDCDIFPVAVLGAFHAKRGEFYDLEVYRVETVFMIRVVVRPEDALMAAAHCHARTFSQARGKVPRAFVNRGNERSSFGVGLSGA
jgi:hypothetical protein